MTRRTEPTIPAEGAAERGFTREKLVRMQEYVRTNGIPLSDIRTFIVKHTCIECVMADGHRKVLSYAT
jgi:maleate cis-trans isomerase